MADLKSVRQTISLKSRRKRKMPRNSRGACSTRATRHTNQRKPTKDHDCHGYTFLNGEKCIDNDQLPAILNDNGYLETQTPAVGDIVIYVFGGKLVHSGVITEVKGGIVTKITSKWGRWG